MRINKYLALCGFGSRRAVEELVRDGAVKAGGKVIDDLSFRVEEGARITVNGKPAVPPQKREYILFNKPPGYLCSRSDPYERQLIYDLLPKKYLRLHYVGRLDYQSRGLLVLTDEGDLTQKLLHPSFEVPRTYLVQTRKVIGREDLETLRRGVEIDEGETTKPVAVKVLGENRYEIVLKEGKNREIRRMLEVVGHKVVDLQRIRFGGLELGDLPEGGFRTLDSGEIARLHEKTRTQTHDD